MSHSKTSNREKSVPGVQIDSARMQLATKMAELAQQYNSNQKVCSWGLRFLLHNGLDEMRYRSLDSFDTGLTIAYHAGKGLPELSRDEAMQAFRFAKGVADLPESVVVAFFAATAGCKDMQKALEGILWPIEAEELK